MQSIILTYSTIITLTTLFSYINHKYFKLQNTISVMLAALFLAIILVGLNILYPTLKPISTITKLFPLDEFKNILLNGMLSFLLFAGALHVDIEHFKRQKWIIATLSTVSTIASTLLLGSCMYYLFQWTHIQIGFTYCMLFGALISPTDPIAVLATLKKVKAPARLHAIVSGESLFNDGVGIVLFLSLYQLTFTQNTLHLNHLVILFIRQALGGLAYGYILGILCNYLFQKIKYDSFICIMLTLTITTSGYFLAQLVDISGPLAMVAAGLVIRSTTPPQYQNKTQTLLIFWEVIDELLNAALFFLIGLECFLITPQHRFLALIPASILLVLLIRYISVAMPLHIFCHLKYAKHKDILVIVWGGLRGGLAVALALTLPATIERDYILAITYAIVIFSIIVQGTTLKPLLRLKLADEKHG